MREWKRVIYEAIGEKKFAQGYATEDDMFIYLEQENKKIAINKHKIISIMVYNDDNRDNEQAEDYDQFISDGY